MESVNQLITWGDISMFNEVYKSAYNLDISMVNGVCKSAYNLDIYIYIYGYWSL